jgi:PHP family Zn ribbon phosphoesterase
MRSNSMTTLIGRYWLHRFACLTCQETFTTSYSDELTPQDLQCPTCGGAVEPWSCRYFYPQDDADHV